MKTFLFKSKAEFIQTTQVKKKKKKDIIQTMTTECVHCKSTQLSLRNQTRVYQNIF